ncbi:MAG TPA: DUF6431 domain-containing protein [Bryobacteraceae bacterium]
MLGGYPSGRAFAPTVIVVIPHSSSECNSQGEESEWLPRQCPACRRMAVIGNGRRLRSAHDGEHDRIRVRRGRCKGCGRSVTVLPERCIPGASYSLAARQQAVQRIASGIAVEQAAPDCLDPDRIADPSTLRRWCRRRIESLVFAVYRVTTWFAWDWRAAARILIPEPNPL